MRAQCTSAGEARVTKARRNEKETILKQYSVLLRTAAHSQSKPSTAESSISMCGLPIGLCDRNVQRNTNDWWIGSRVES